jgi:ribonuclease III
VAAVLRRRAASDAAVLSQILGYEFTNAELLRHALTHGNGRVRRDNYQRLEFLGDRVLGLIIAEALFKQSGHETEGEMSNRHSALVRGETCAAVGRALDLGSFIIVAEGEKKTGVHRIDSVVGDVVEALIGAIYLDGGLAAAAAFVHQHWAGFLAQETMVRKDAKTQMQEWALGRALAIPRYETVHRDGPEHQPEFTVALTVGSFPPTQGKGASKRAAEMVAADNFLKREGIN